MSASATPTERPAAGVSGRRIIAPAECRPGPPLAARWGFVAFRSPPGVWIRCAGPDASTVRSCASLCAMLRTSAGNTSPPQGRCARCRCAQALGHRPLADATNSAKSSAPIAQMGGPDAMHAALRITTPLVQAEQRRARQGAGHARCCRRALTWDEKALTRAGVWPPAPAARGPPRGARGTDADYCAGRYTRRHESVPALVASPRGKRGRSGSSHRKCASPHHVPWRARHGRTARPAGVFGCATA
jgi:hypothetical protein